MVVTVISVRIAPPPRKAEVADEDIIRESVMAKIATEVAATKTATTKATAVETATAETSPVETATTEASPTETAAAEAAPTVAASAPAVASCPSRVSQGERCDAD